jgi:aminocarboxymuconate-semialdehyde decarboxylase
VKKIDGHRHVCCPDATVAANKIDPVKSISIYPPGIQKETEEINRRKSTDWNRKLGAFDENIADLKAAGMDRAVLQPTQTMFFYWAEPSAGAELARMVNEYTATGVRRHPQEFVGLATVPLQDVERAVQELSYATRELGLKGVVVGSNVNGHGFDEEQFWPFFEKIQELDIPIFIHPNDPAGTERVRRYYIINFLAYPLESTITAAQLVFGGILDRYPKLKICLSHAGGVLPFLLGRLEHGQSVRPEAQASCKNPFHHYLKNFYVDSITHWPETLRFVLNIMPKGHVFMGTDYPYDMADNHPVSSVRAAVSEKEIQEEIFGKNLNAIVDFS